MVRIQAFFSALGSHVEMLAVGRAMPQNLGPEVADVKAEHGALAHRAVSPRRGPHPAVTGQFNPSDRCQPAAKVGVLAVELEALVESADLGERFAAHREVAAV